MAVETYTGPVFSYVRFSSARQAQGDSERRQDDAAKRWCEEKKLTLDTSLRPDRGVSAFNKGNLKGKGNLGLFLKKIQDGRVPSGSTLLVENLDRLSRGAIIAAFNLFWEIIVEHRVRVVTLMDGQEFTAENITKEPESLHRAIGTLIRGHEESQSKSKRLKEVFAELRETLSERKWATNYPPWLELRKDRKTFDVVPAKARVIQRIFRDYDKGVGVFTIARNLQAEKIGRLSDGKCFWQTSTVQHYLKSRAVIGEFQPHQRLEGGMRAPVGAPLRNYFPAIIEKGLFARVAGKITKTKTTRGRRSADLVNLFRGLLRCPYCGSSILLKRQLGKNSRQQDTYVCDRAHRFQTCLAYGWNRHAFEICFLEFAEKVQEEYGSMQVARPKASELPTIIAQLDGVEAEENRLLDLYQKGIVSQDKLETRVAFLRTEKADLSSEKFRLENLASGLTEKQFCLDLETFLTADLNDQKKRDVLAGVISRLFTKIDLYFVGLPSQYRRLLAEKKRLLGEGLKGNQIFFRLANATSFEAEGFFIAHFQDRGAKPYPDFLKDKEFTSLYEDKNAHKEFRELLKKVAPTVATTKRPKGDLPRRR